MNPIVIVTVSWVLCVALLLASQFTGSKSLGLWGDIMLAISFGITSVMLLRAKSYWVGGAFAFPAVRQVYVLVAPRYRRTGAAR